LIERGLASLDDEIEEEDYPTTLEDKRPPAEDDLSDLNE
jgi:hypothetical protein